MMYYDVKWVDRFIDGVMWLFVALAIAAMFTIAMVGCTPKTQPVHPVTSCVELCTATECVVDCTKMPPFKGGVYLKRAWVVRDGKIVKGSER